MSKFVCPVCGYVYEGDAAPEFCPQCKCPGAKFKVQEAEQTYVRRQHFFPTRRAGRVVYTDMPVEGRELGRGPGQALAGFFLTMLTVQACGQGARRRGSLCSASGGVPEPQWAWRSGAMCMVKPRERRSFPELASTCPGAPINTLVTRQCCGSSRLRRTGQKQCCLSFS